MAQYQIQDPKTGKTVVIEGDKPPTQQDAEQIFQQAGLRNNTQTQQPQQQQQSQQSGGLLQSILNPFVKTGQTITSAVENLPTLVGQPAIQAPFKGFDLSPQELQQYSTNPGQQIINQAGRSAAIASYALPIGQGGNFVSKFLAPGAAVGAAQAAGQQDNPTLGRVAGGAVTGAATAGVLGGLGNLGGLISRGAKSAATDVLKGQYAGIPASTARKNLVGDTVTQLKNYGIKNVKDIPEAANTVTGEQGILNKYVNNAVANAKPVNLGQINIPGVPTPQPSVMDIAKDLANSSLNKSNTNNFLYTIQKGLGQASGGERGGLNPNSNPTEVLGFIKDLQGKAADLTKGRSPTVISSQDKALAGAYKSMAQELETRLFQDSGADAQVLANKISPEDLAKLAKISPKLAQDAQNATTIGQLRSLQAPFVRGSQLVQELENRVANKIPLSLSDLGAGGLGELAGLSFGSGPLGLALGIGGIVGKKAVNSNAGRTAISGLLDKTAGATSKSLSPALSRILSQASIRVPIGVNR